MLRGKPNDTTCAKIIEEASNTLVNPYSSGEKTRGNTITVLRKPIPIPI
jgi:hypothetical protein